MNRSFSIRVAGLLLAILSFAPALDTMLNASPIDLVPLFRPFYHPLWWWRWVGSWMPTIRFPWKSFADVIQSLPGLFALSVVGMGLAVCFHRNRRPRQRWEDRS